MNNKECLGLCGGITQALLEKGFGFVRFGLVIWKRGETEPCFVGSNETDTSEIGAMFEIAKNTVTATEGEYHRIDDDDCEGHA